MRRVCASMASVTTAGDGGSGMEPARIEALVLSSCPGVLIRDELGPSVSSLLSVSLQSSFAICVCQLTFPHRSANASFFAASSRSSEQLLSDHPPG